jgi:hypothetical protein
MAAIAKVLARKFPSTDLEVEVLKQIALFSGAGLLVSLVLMSYGLDLSPGFFWPQNAQRRLSGIWSLGGAGLDTEPSNPSATGIAARGGSGVFTQTGEGTVSWLIGCTLVPFPHGTIPN